MTDALAIELPPGASFRAGCIPVVLHFEFIVSIKFRIKFSIEVCDFAQCVDQQKGLESWCRCRTELKLLPHMSNYGWVSAT